MFPITITFDEPLQTGATLLPSEITVIGGSITGFLEIPSANSYVATLEPNPGVTTVTVQVNASAVADAGGVQNAATPSPHTPLRLLQPVRHREQEPRQDAEVSENLLAVK